MNSTAIADMLEENQRQRYLARRAAERRRGVTHGGAREASLPKVPLAGDSATTPKPCGVANPMPWLFVLIVASCVGIWGLAIVGAYAIIRAVFGA